MWKRLYTALSAVLTFSVLAMAQSGNGIVKGTIMDATGSSISGASVRLTRIATKSLRSAVTAEGGTYYFGEIAPGQYSVTVEHAGFKRWTGQFTVQVGQTATVDAPMQVGDVSSSVEVTDAAPVITTEGMQISDVKDSVRIRQLPLNGRNVSNLFNLTAGVEGGGAARVNGMKVGSMEILQDGVSIVDRFSGGISRIQPGLDTVQEFRIETNGSNARYSRPATVTLITRSGTNNFHGAAFETHRNNSGGLRARARQDGNTSAKLIRNEFGVSGGGPVLIPKLYNGKNKTFWFAAYEGLRQSQASFYDDVVPTEAMWNGNFNSLIDNNGVRTNIYDPLTTGANGLRTPFVGNLIPSARFSPIYKTISTLVHRPTLDVNPYQENNIRTYYPLTNKNNNFTTRVDHRFSDKDSVSGRFTRSGLTNSQAGGRYGAPVEGLADAFGSGNSRTLVYNASVTENHIFSPTFFSELLLSVNRNPNRQGTLADNSPWAQRLGLPNPFGTTGWPTICTDLFCFDNDNRKDQNLTAFNIEENMTLIRGKHSLQFGGKIRKEFNNVRELQQSQGSHDFAEDWTGLFDPSADAIASYTGNGLASMALGLPTYLSNQYNRGYFYFQQKEMGLYVHDTWRVAPKLTIDIGVRWDKWTPYKEKYDRMVNVDLDKFATQFQVVTPGNTAMESIPGIPPSVLGSWAGRGLSWTTANKAGLPSSLLPADNNNLAPRIGAAYRLNEKTTIRGGYGEYFWTMPLSQILQTSRTNPPLNLRYTNPIANLDGTSQTALRYAPAANQYVGAAAVDTNGQVFIPNSAQSIMPWDYRNWHDGHSREWNLTVERSLGRQTSIRVSYVGSHASDLEQRFQLNGRESEYNYQARTGLIRPTVSDNLRVNPNWNFNASGKFGYSNNHSAQVEFNKRYSNGLTFQWFYVFTRALNTSDVGASTSGNGSLNDTAGGAVVPENSQILGSPKLTFDERLRLTYFNSTYIPAHRMRWNALYELPFGRGKKFGGSVNGFTNAVIGGWQFATIGEWHGGNYLSVDPSVYQFGNPSLSSDQRLDLTYNGRSQTLYFRGDFNPLNASNVDAQKLQSLVPVDRNQRILRPVGPAFDNRVPQLLANGTTRLTSITDNISWNSRAFLIGPRNWNADFSVFKWFQIKEQMRVRLTGDFFNGMNHPNSGNPNGVTGLLDRSRQSNEPRTVQVSARVEW